MAEGDRLPQTDRKGRSADRQGPDSYSAPAWQTHALIDNERLRGKIAECARGGGGMPAVLVGRATPLSALISFRGRSDVITNERQGGVAAPQSEK